MGAVGIPIFSGFSGGFGILLGMTGGFLWGFLLMAVLCGIGVQLNRRLWAIVLGLSGCALSYLRHISVYAGDGLHLSCSRF